MSLTVQVSNNEVTVSQNAASSVEIAQELRELKELLELPDRKVLKAQPVT